MGGGIAILFGLGPDVKRCKNDICPTLKKHWRGG
jgi:hypothetical protein